VTFKYFAALSVAAASLACGPSAVYSIGLNSRLKTIDVGGIPPSALSQLDKAGWTEEQWQALMRVSVQSPGGATMPAVAGRYEVSGAVLRFTPQFPFDAGRPYDVRFDPSRLPGAHSTPGAASLAAVVTLPAIDLTPSTVVSQLYPSAHSVPANQLRLYLHFSAPMDWRSGYDYVKLLDDRGQEVPDTFLPLDADFWNADRTRYTVFYDPGRVKRGILPNRQRGRALEAGRRYTLVVKREWRDGHGQPLKDEFRHEFTATRAIERPLSMSDWKIDLPPVGTRNPLMVTFPAALDHGLLQRALSVARDDMPVDGDATVDSGETVWRFAPRAPWQRGGYSLVALEFLEDVAGNRIGRAFEVDNFERTDRTPQPERFTRPFNVDR
jgi:hypothetical protein